MLSVALKAVMIAMSGHLAFAQAILSSERESPGRALRNAEPAEVLFPLSLHQTLGSELPTTLTLVTWNIHKAADGDAWARDLAQLGAGTQLMLVQEAVDTDFVKRSLKQLNHHSFVMARSFFYDSGDGTGVATGSDFSFQGLGFRLSPGREPLTNTPKATLISTYQMTDKVPLMVLNVHGINFVTNDRLLEQLLELKPVISKFKGRVVLAGDFNTWNSGRISLLKNFARQLGLHHVGIRNDPRRLVLDHVFLRGCKVLKSVVDSSYKSSDHWPIKVKFQCQ